MDMDVRFEWIDGIEKVAKEEWNALCGDEVNPYHEWEWLYCLEASGSASKRTGWRPMHLLVRAPGGELVAAAPLYIKSNSNGEYVYDFAWADVAQQLGTSYYPKLVGTIPATPSCDYRFLIADVSNAPLIVPLMLAEIDRQARKTGMRGIHLLFTDPGLSAFLKNDKAWTAWIHHRYLWANDGYSDFAGFSEDITKNQRRNIRRERDEVQAQGIKVDILPLDQDADTRLTGWMYEYYDKTNDQFGPWAARYLYPEFFTLAAQHFKHRLAYAVAQNEDSRGGKPLAMAYLLHKKDWLFGRFWGAEGFHPSLHFEVCYYKPIEWAIERGVRFFDPGAGSPHKIRRGFEAVETPSFHRFYDERMDLVFRRYMPQVNEQECDQIRVLNLESPLKKNQGLRKETNGD